MSYLQFIRGKSNLSFYVPKLFSPASSPTLLPTENKVKSKRFQPLYNLTVRFPMYLEFVSENLHRNVSENLHRIMPALQVMSAMDTDYPVKKASVLIPWHHTYFKRVKMLFSEGMGSDFSTVFAAHPLHPNVCAKIFWKSWIKWQNRNWRACQQKEKVLGTVIPVPQVPLSHPHFLCSRLGGTSRR